MYVLRVCAMFETRAGVPILVLYAPFSLETLIFMPSKLNFHVSLDLPPPKRRRTLAGSIISTALSAALIGTAVGLTVYRL